MAISACCSKDLFTNILCHSPISNIPDMDLCMLTSQLIVSVLEYENPQYPRVITDVNNSPSSDMLLCVDTSLTSLCLTSSRTSYMRTERKMMLRLSSYTGSYILHTYLITQFFFVFIIHKVRKLGTSVPKTVINGFGFCIKLFEKVFIAPAITVCRNEKTLSTVANTFLFSELSQIWSWRVC